MLRPGSRTLAALAVTGILALVFASASPASPVSPRIVGGSSVSIAQFPFQAAVYIQEDPLGLTEAFCGGVVIDPLQVVTAAHCMENDITGNPVSPSNVTVLVGTSTLPQGTPSGPTASRIAIDPSYDPNTNEFDIAVITMPHPLYSGSPRANGSTTVAPIGLITPGLAARFANPNAVPPEPAMVSGWGTTSPQSPNQVRRQGRCRASSGLRASILCPTPPARATTRGDGQPITPQMICASDPGKDSCTGDSGGPLVVDVDDPARPPGDYVLAGTVDFGVGCAQSELPGRLRENRRPRDHVVHHGAGRHRQPAAADASRVDGPGPTPREQALHCDALHRDCGARGRGDARDQVGERCADPPWRSPARKGAPDQRRLQGQNPGPQTGGQVHAPPERRADQQCADASGVKVRLRTK